MRSAAGDIFNAFPRWSARGDALTFLSAKTDDGYTLFDVFPPHVRVVITNAGGGSRRVVPVPSGLSSLLDPAWTTDRSHLLVVGVHADGTQDLYRIAVDGSGLKRIAITGAVGARHRVNTPIMSSTGQIAFVQDDTIYVLDGKGHPRKLHRGVDPDFSPHGKQIVFFDQSNDAIDSIVIDGRRLRRLRKFARGVDLSPHPVYSPNGRYIAFVLTTSVGGTDRLERMRADGSQLRDLRLSGYSALDPDWQPLLDRH